MSLGNFSMNVKKFRLDLDDHLLAAQAYFNVAPDDMFLTIMNGLSLGWGTDYNGVGCVLPGDVDRDPPDSGGVFYIGSQEEIWLSDPAIYELMTTAITVYLESNPDKKETAEPILARAAEHFVK